MTPLHGNSFKTATNQIFRKYGNKPNDADKILAYIFKKGITGGVIGESLLAYGGPGDHWSTRQNDIGTGFLVGVVVGITAPISIPAFVICSIYYSNIKKL